MASDEGPGDDDPVAPLLPPDDRIWRHPSEVRAAGPPGGDPPGGWPSADPAPAPSPRWLLGAVAWLLSAAVAGVAAIVVGVGRPVRTVAVPAVERVVAPGSVGPMTAPPDAVMAVAERLRPVVLRIRADGARGPGEGSGVVFRSDGHVLTNDHVVAGARSVLVVAADGSQLEADVVGRDPETDVAVLKIRLAQDDVITAVIGTVASVRVGQMAIAVGGPNGGPGGTGRPSMTVGVVRAVGLDVEAPGRPPLPDMIQTDLPVTVAASGGPLVDAAGAVIGITTDLAGSTPTAGRVGYATPIDVARDVAVQLIATGRVTRSWLGIEGEDLDASTAASLGLSGGARVTSVSEASPASRGGLVAGDVVTSLDGQPIRSLGALKSLLRGYRPGGTVSLSVLGPGGPRSLRVTLAERGRAP